MKFGIVLYSDDAETVWNAFRLGNFAVEQGDETKIFLLAKGVDFQSLDSGRFNIKGQMNDFVKQRGKIYACGTCLKMRDARTPELCDLSTLADLYGIIKECDKVISL